MNSSLMAARDLIMSAFADVPYPGDDHITSHQDCLECEAIARYFCGTSWRDHQLAKLWEYHAAIALFTPQAFHYFLPAFMLATLEHPQDADLIPHSIASQFTRPLQTENDERCRYFTDRFSLFTAPQRAAIAAFLRGYAATGEFWAGEVPEALATLEA
jgi:hypothetical protein